MRRRGRRTWWWPGAVSVVLLAVGIAAALAARSARPRVEPRFVGGASCIDCHRDQHQQWLESHHYRAMEPANASTVLGNFNDARHSEAGITTTFSKVGERFIVRTEGPDGKLADFPVGYTFGFEPLQQYLIDLPGGRKQSLTIAWDAKNHRWFSLYPDRSVAPDDWLHWTQRAQNWNSNCAECHSTNLRKNYDLKSDTYNTTWSEINVSCEQCHGPASAHVDWANASAALRWWRGYDDKSKGLVLKLKDPHRAWEFGPDGQPRLAAAADADPTVQVEMCAQCHARRGPVSAEFRHGERFLDHYMPQLIQENIYHPDGQILDEVYEYGSFIQSRMFHHGVRCTDCHNPHSGRTILTGNALCARCHVPAKYDTPQHHFHSITASGAPGTNCVDCHMPTRTYMVVDPRRDHSLRIPRPDLSVKIGTPNACTQCHEDQSAQWAAEAVEKWYGLTRRDDPHYGPIFASAWVGEPAAGAELRGLLLDKNRPAWVRASAASALQGYFSREAVAAATQTLADPDPLVRSMSAALLSGLPPAERVEPLGPLLDDPVRAVRQIAGRSLLSVPRESLSAPLQAALDRALGDQTEAMVAHSDNVAGRMALAGLYQELGQFDQAQRAFEAAIAMDRHNLDAQMALAEFHIRRGNDAAAEELLRKILQLRRPPELPEHMWDRARGTVQYQLGLLLANNPARAREGLHHILQASELLPNVARLYYNLGELHSHLRQPTEAERAYRKAIELQPDDPDPLFALTMLYLEQQRPADAQNIAQRLADLLPDDPQVRLLLDRTRSTP